MLNEGSLDPFSFDLKFMNNSDSLRDKTSFIYQSDLFSTCGSMMNQKVFNLM